MEVGTRAGLTQGSVLTALYFPNETLMNATHGYIASLIRSSILEGRSLLAKQGQQWLFRNGESVDVRRDCWVPRLVGRSQYDRTIKT